MKPNNQLSTPTVGSGAMTAINYDQVEADGTGLSEKMTFGLRTERKGISVETINKGLD